MGAARSDDLGRGLRVLRYLGQVVKLAAHDLGAADGAVQDAFEGEHSDHDSRGGDTPSHLDSSVTYALRFGPVSAWREAVPRIRLNAWSDILNPLR